MIARTTTLLGAVLAVAGCLSAPQTPDEVRRMASSNPFLQVQNFSAARSVSAVNASLSAGAQKCLNRNATQSYANTYGGYSTVAVQYRTTVRGTSSGGELVMHQKIVGGATVIGNKDGGLAYVVDVTPAAGGSKLTIYGGKSGYRDIDAAVISWARGGAIRCPNNMPVGT